jgi:hypothetical protein
MIEMQGLFARQLAGRCTVAENAHPLVLGEGVHDLCEGKEMGHRPPLLRVGKGKACSSARNIEAPAHLPGQGCMLARKLHR